MSKLCLLALDDVAVYALRVSCILHAMRYKLRMMCCISKTQTYTEMLNLAIGV